MVQPRYRARTFRRVFVRTPGAKTRMLYKRRKPARAECAGCGCFLQSVPQVRSSVMARLPKTAKRPERPYGGMYCGACMRKMMKQRARAL